MTDCVSLADVAYVAEEWRIYAKARLDDGGVRVRDDSRRRLHGRVGDEIELVDGFNPHRFTRIADEITVAETWETEAISSIRLADVVRARDSQRGSVHKQLADGVDVHDAVVARPRSRWADATDVSEAWKPVGTPVARLSDVVRVRDRFKIKRAARLADEVQATDAMAKRVHGRLADETQFDDELRTVAHGHMRLADIFKATDAIQVHANPRARLADEVFVSERWRLPREVVVPDGHVAHRLGHATAWTANTDTWGGSRYTDFEFNSIAVVDGVLMGANDAGLWRLDALDDDGAPILAHIQTDMQDYGAEQVKAAPLVYAGMATDGAMQLTVDAVIKGTPAFYTYTFEPRQAGDFAPARCKIGRGVRSRYLQFTVGNHSGDGSLAAGADFTIDQLSVLAEAGSRRV